MTVERLLTADDVADRLRLGRSTVYEMARRGELSSVEIRRGRGRTIRRFREADIEAYIEANTVGVEKP